MKRLTMILVMFALLLVSLSNAQQTWERNYGGAGNDGGYSVRQTQDGGYIIAGWTTSFGNGYQVYLIKTNASGDTLWTRTYGGTGVDEGYSIQQTSDGGYIVAGETYSFGDSVQVYLIKTNASGDTLWTRTYGGAGIDYSWSVQQTQDTGFVVAGVTTSFGNGVQVYLIKTNASGDTLWTRNYGGVGDDYGWSVQQSQGGGYIVAGIYDYFGSDPQVYLVKTNAQGDTIWTRLYGGTSVDEGHSVQQTQDGGYVVAGYTGSFGNRGQVYLIKTNASGDTLWTRNYGGADFDDGWSVQQTSDTGYIVAGRYNAVGTVPQVYLIKTNASGDTLWTRDYGGTDNDWGFSVKQTTDGGYIVAGFTESFGNGRQVYLIKTDANGNVGVGEGTEVRGKRLEVRLTAKPNPFTSFATLSGHEAERFSLYDISGRLVGYYKGDRVGWDVSPGIYFLRLYTLHPTPYTQLLRIVKIR
jgi:hypothetical protein